jgi:hypothetical protein
MQLTADKDVKAVLEFMQEKVPASKLVAVADQVSELARLLWGHYPADEITPLQLDRQPIA